jgi:hypothetical protein
MSKAFQGTGCSDPQQEGAISAAGPGVEIGHRQFRVAPELTEITIQDIYAALVDDVSRNEMIADDIVRTVESGRCPLLLTGRSGLTL